MKKSLSDDVVREFSNRDDLPWVFLGGFEHVRAMLTTAQTPILERGRSLGSMPLFFCRAELKETDHMGRVSNYPK